MYRRYLYRNTFKSICIGIPIQFAESIGIGILSRWKEKYRQTKVANFVASVSAFLVAGGLFPDRWIFFESAAGSGRQRSRDCQRGDT